ncbi:cytosine permease [Neobacillus niacini]|uniref:purine-cytosine permease family protein n=1 Tax=Neobacillus niacini TaxID=86668 RepID=UPI002FFF2E7D
MAKIQENLESHDDHSLRRVPDSDKRPMWQVLVVRLGFFACVSQLMLGAALGYGMSFWDAFWAVMFGSVILQIIGFGIGFAAAKEGLSTALLTRWSGFGNLGSLLIGLVIAISLTGWFGVQNGVFALGIYEATNMFNVQIWSVITGLGLTLLVVYGFKVLSYTANIALPLFLVAVGIAAYKLLATTDIGSLLVSPAPGTALPMGVAITMVTGGFVVGVVTTPDISRYVRTWKDVFWMTAISTFVGELSICLIAVLMAHTVKSPDVVTIMLSLSGWLGASIVLFSTIKTNDLNLYSSSLGLTNSMNIFFKKNFNRVTMTIVVGLFGTFMSVAGILDKFIGFLVLLGIVIPPVVGVIIVDYFILKRSKAELDESRKNNELPKHSESWNPISIVAWIAGFAVGYFVTDIGVSSLNSLVASGVVYYIGMKLFGSAITIKKVETGISVIKSDTGISK